MYHARAHTSHQRCTTLLIKLVHDIQMRHKGRLSRMEQQKNALPPNFYLDEVHGVIHDINCINSSPDRFPSPASIAYTLSVPLYYLESLPRDSPLPHHRHIHCHSKPSSYQLVTN